MATIQTEFISQFAYGIWDSNHNTHSLSIQEIQCDYSFAVGQL